MVFRVGDRQMNRGFRHLGTGMFEGRPERRAFGLRHILIGALLAAMAGPITFVAVHAEDQVAPQPEPGVTAAGDPKPLDQPKPTDAPKDAPKAEAPKPPDAPVSSFRAAVRAMVEQEVQKTGLPADIADAVVQVESNYNPSVIGGVGEIGLMQIRPGTAAMLGFRGSAEELAKPETNIHYGVIYLSKAWRLADGDLCRTLMKYRAGHGEEVMTPRSVHYCNRARNHLAALGSPLGAGGTPPPAIIPASVLANISAKPVLISPKDVYAQYRQGTPAASRAYWAAHEARIRAIKARIESRWHRMASR
jgi:transglycosylase-like protein with SLT domain